MMSGRGQAVQSIITEPGGITIASILTWMADIIMEMTLPMLMEWLGEAGGEEGVFWRGPRWKWDQQISDFHDYIKTAFYTAQLLYSWS